MLTILLTSAGVATILTGAYQAATSHAPSERTRCRAAARERVFRAQRTALIGLSLLLVAALI